MKRFLSYVSILLIAFGACLLTACQDPYSKVSLQIYSGGQSVNTNNVFEYVLGSSEDDTFSFDVYIF